VSSCNSSRHIMLKMWPSRLLLLIALALQASPADNFLLTPCSDARLHARTTLCAGRLPGVGTISRPKRLLRFDARKSSKLYNNMGLTAHNHCGRHKTWISIMPTWPLFNPIWRAGVFSDNETGPSHLSQTHSQKLCKHVNVCAQSDTQLV